MKNDLERLKVAIVHDWLVGGGAERVVFELHRIFPDAPIYTSYATDVWRKRLDGKVVTGWLQHFGRLRKFMALGRIWWFSRLDFSGYDLVISSSGNGEAFSVHVPKGVTHVCYCHTPTHYYWRHYDQYLARPGFGAFDWLARLGLRLLVGPLRRWDWRAAQRPDFYVANSNHIKQDIKTYYGRDAVVIHPPIDVGRFRADVPQTERMRFVTVGRQAPYKRTDLIVAACTRLNLPLDVLGDGPDHEHLKKLAGPSVRFVPHPSDAEVAKCLNHAKAFLFAAFEDFGVTPVEALAAGAPVIAFKAGGAHDYVVPGKTGLFFGEQTVDSLVAALRKFNPGDYKPAELAEFARTFSAENFVREFRSFLFKNL